MDTLTFCLRAYALANALQVTLAELPQPAAAEGAARRALAECLEQLADRVLDLAALAAPAEEGPCPWCGEEDCEASCTAAIACAKPHEEAMGDA